MEDTMIRSDTLPAERGEARAADAAEARVIDAGKLQKPRRKLTKDWALWVVFGVFLIYAITLVFPFVWMLFNSVKSNQEYFRNIWAFPQSFHIENYTNVLFNYSVHNVSLFGMFGISIVITLCGTVLSLLMSSIAAYVIAKYKFFGRNALYALAVFVMAVPVAGTLPAQYNIMQTLHLTNSFIGVLILYAGGFGFNFLILYGFFKNLSWEYAEAALIDGCTDFGIFFKIMLPMAKPALIAVGVIHAIGLWNDYVTPSIYLPNTPTLAVGVNLLLSELRGQSAYPEMFATMIIALIPILVVFICFQKTIMENTVAGGLKG